MTVNETLLFFLNSTFYEIISKLKFVSTFCEQYPCPYFKLRCRQYALQTTALKRVTKRKYPYVGTMGTAAFGRHFV